MKEINTPEELLNLRDKNGKIHVKDDLKITCDITWSAGKDINGILVEGNLYCKGDYLIIMGDLFWSHASVPNLPEKTYIKRVLPQAWQRQYYQDRLGMDIGCGCYNEICVKVLKQIINLLNDDKWTPTERWMLETLRDSEKKLPEWVGEAKDGKA